MCIRDRFVSMCLGQIVLFSGNHIVKVKLRGWKMQGRIIKDIYAVGAPAILMQSIASIMQFGMNLILGGINETAVAVLGVYGRLQSFIFMPVFGLNQGVLPIMGYNYGARNRKRLMSTYKKGFTIAFCIMAFGLIPVSYTHLDVYKRQATGRILRYSMVRIQYSGETVYDKK